MNRIPRLLYFFLTVCSFYGFHRKPFLTYHKFSILRSSWQNDLDRFLDVDTSCDSRVDLAKRLSSKVNEVAADVIDAVLDRDLTKIAPKELEYGKSLRGIKTVRKQLFSDIIPDLLQKGIPNALEKGPKVVGKILSMGPSGVIERGQVALEKARKFTEDQSKLEETLSDVRKELKNLVKRTPEGLEAPAYSVLETREFYEIRRYEPFSVCTTQATSAFSGAEMAYNSSKGFRVLASYLSGNNQRDGEAEKLSMTVPVMVEDTTMSFVLPAGLTASTAPQPTSAKVILQDIPEEFLAVREFTGFITEGEVARQRAKLEDALISDSMMYESLSFKVMAYNSPLTLPWVRRNEVSFRLKLSPGDHLRNIGTEIAMTAKPTTPASAEDAEPSNGDHGHFSAPEAGD